MKSTINSRRAWLKSGAMLLGGAALTPSHLWANPAEATPKKGSLFLFENTQSSLREFRPSKFPDLSTMKARLMWNENPYGPSPKAAGAFQKAVFEGNHYSWGSLNKLMGKIAEKEGVDIDNVMMGPGSSDLLEKAAMVYFKEGGNVVSADPSYMSLVTVAKACGGAWKAVKLTADYQHDLKAMEAAIDADTKMVYITNPNNPTATLTDKQALMDFCSRVSEKIPVFVDEAYIELSAEGMKNSMAPLVAQGKNVFVARTFSKIHGMAGIRVGYMLGNKESLKVINEITRGGMGITGPSIEAASTSMDDLEFLEGCKAKITEARNFTFDLLNSKKIAYMPSQTNFVLFPIEMEGDAFLDKIYDQKVAVRTFRFWDQNWCRVSMGTMEEMQYFADALNTIIS